MKRNIFKFSFVFFAATLVLAACTKLEPKPYSGLTTEEYYKDSNSVNNAQDFVTTALIGFGNGEQTRIGNAAAFEMVDPLDRFGAIDGTPLYIKDAYQHNFKPALIRFDQMWITFYTGISKANLTLSELAELKNRPSRIIKVEAELKIARAFFFFHAMDCFGNIPLDTMLNADPETVKTNSRMEVFNFIEKELLNNIPLLDDRIAPNNRMNKFVANTLLAQLYLNAKVYTGTPQWAKVIPACDAVINSGKYKLTTNYFENFSGQNSKDENILVSFREDIPGAGTNTFITENLYDTGGPAVGIVGSPWNGFVGTAELYNVYQSEDVRRRQWLVGPQRASASVTERAVDGIPNTGEELTGIDNKSKSRLVYNTNIRGFGYDPKIRTNPKDSQLMAGPRNVKYYPKRGGIVGTDLGNDYVIMRLADVIMMKGEAQFRMGDIAGAIATINPVRARGFGGKTNFNFTTLTIEDIRDERTREFMQENYARRDNIRFEDAGSAIKYWSGKAGEIRKDNGESFSPKKYLKDKEDGSINTRLYPIPVKQLILNPKLVQNPGY